MAEHKKGMLDLPPEIRLRIYEYIRCCQKTLEYGTSHDFHFGEDVVKGECSRYRKFDLSILRTNRLLHEEAARVLLRYTKVTVHIHPNERYAADYYLSSRLGQVEDMLIWPFVTILVLKATLARSAYELTTSVNRMKRFVEAIEYGKHLKKLTIQLWIIPISETIVLLEAMKVLRALRVSGEVKVMLCQPDWHSSTEWTDLECEALCLELESVIKGMFMYYFYCRTRAEAE